MSSWLDQKTLCGSSGLASSTLALASFNLQLATPSNSYYRKYPHMRVYVQVCLLIDVSLLARLYHIMLSHSNKITDVFFTWKQTDQYKKCNPFFCLNPSLILLGVKAGCTVMETVWVWAVYKNLIRHSAVYYTTIFSTKEWSYVSPFEKNSGVLCTNLSASVLKEVSLF